MNAAVVTFSSDFSWCLLSLSTPFWKLRSSWAKKKRNSKSFFTQACRLCLSLSLHSSPLPFLKGLSLREEPPSLQHPPLLSRGPSFGVRLQSAWGRKGRRLLPSFPHLALGRGEEDCVCISCWILPSRLPPPPELPSSTFNGVGGGREEGGEHPPCSGTIGIPRD